MGGFWHLSFASHENAEEHLVRLRGYSNLQFQTFRSGFCVYSVKENFGLSYAIATLSQLLLLQFNGPRLIRQGVLRSELKETREIKIQRIFAEKFVLM
eukprot:Seg4718.5 transcript_id=Seg4718.5/GoldUCD/mRNA.D3Y31 product="hypothetical protein" protein_id=Seg4718.5/GoldUCD/D3Y31